MHILAFRMEREFSMQEKLFRMAKDARQRLPKDSYAAKMYEFVKAQYNSGVT